MSAVSFVCKRASCLLFPRENRKNIRPQLQSLHQSLGTVKSICKTVAVFIFIYESVDFYKRVMKKH